MTLPATVKDLMTAVVVCVDLNDTIDAVARNMKLAHVRHIPVVDGDGHVVGLLSYHDLVKAILHAGGHGPQPVERVMTRALTVVTGETPIHEAIAIMLEHKYGCLPVIEPGGKLVGIITESDFLYFTYEKVTGVRYTPTWVKRAVD